MSLPIWLAIGAAIWLAIVVPILIGIRITERPRTPKPPFRPTVVPEPECPDYPEPERPDDPSDERDYWIDHLVRVPREFSRFPRAAGDYEFGRVVDVYYFADGENGPSPDDEFAPIDKLRVEFADGSRRTVSREAAERC